MKKVTTKVFDPTKYDEVVTTKGCEMIGAFSFKIIHAWTNTSFTSVRLNVMIHALCASRFDAYTEMHNGSKNVAGVVRNSMACPQTPRKKIPVEKVVTANQVPEPQV